MDKTITQFRGQYFFLSNFFPSKIIYEEQTYPTLEHAFQAAKCVSENDKLKIRNCKSAKEAKMIGRRVKIINEWDNKRKEIMRELLEKKFQQNTQLNISLQATAPEKIVENNYWHDNFWGQCTCGKHRNEKGENILGGLLMEVRDKQQ